MRTMSVVLLLLATSGAQPPAKPDTQEAAKLGEEIEQSVRWYDVLPEEGAAPLAPVPVIRWRNVARGQEGEAMMVIWPHNGRPVAMASIYPWNGSMTHEFDSLSRDSKLQHLDALGERRERLRMLVRRPRRRNEQHALQPALLPALLRQDQMAQVDRIKRAAEYAEPHDAIFSAIGPI